MLKEASGVWFEIRGFQLGLMIDFIKQQGDLNRCVNQNIEYGD